MIPATILYIVNFIKTLLIIAIIYYAIRLFTRYVLPFLIQKGVKNMQQKMQEQFRNQQTNGRPEGDVTIQGNGNINKNRNSDKGEYVDFEEVE